MNDSEKQAVLRLLDANFNRAREALRVMEDFARFILNRADLSKKAKELRHALSQSVANTFDNTDLCWSRDTAGDVGTTITTPTEQQRSALSAVVVAAAKRLSEALRCLEEYGKLAWPAWSAQIEQIRYQSYQLEKLLTDQLALANRFAAVKIYVLVTAALCRRPILELCKEILDAGVDCIQLREKELTDHALLKQAAVLAQLCHDRRALFLVNDRPDLAVLSGADGVHLGQDDLSLADARRILRPGMIAGKSTHSDTELAAALVQTPDYVAIGAVFPSPTKPGVPAIGLDKVRAIVARVACPVIAIGGITPDNAAQVLAAGASGIAVCQAVIAAEHPGRVVEQLRRAIAAAS